MIAGLAGCGLGAPGGLAALAGLAPVVAQAQSVELATLRAQRSDNELRLDFDARLRLSAPIEDALQRGLPLYFVAEAALYRSRWYWRDRRVARARRTWRLAFQPLTATWRVGLGALSQSFDTLPEALTALSAAGGWVVATLPDTADASDHYLEFSYRLDTGQLPSPMQISLASQPDWALQVERTLALPAPGPHLP